MWAITSYFNPAHYSTRLANYQRFRDQLSVPLVTVELSFTGEFELGQGDADHLIQISGGSVLWQKERLLNIAATHVPPGHHIAWIDCDVVFEHSDWPQQALAQLESHAMVQLFGHCVDLEPGQTAIPDHPPLRALGIVAKIEKDGITALERQSKYSWGFPQREVMPGLAWCLRRDIFDQHGLYDAMIVGAADRMLLHAAYGELDSPPTTVPITDAHWQHYLRWARPFYHTVQGSVGHIDHTVGHLWHGEIPNRRYWDRHDELVRLDFDPDRDIVVGASGAWQCLRPDIEAYAVRYFEGRQEDTRYTHND